TQLAIQGRRSEPERVGILYAVQWRGRARHACPACRAGGLPGAGDVHGHGSNWRGGPRQCREREINLSLIANLPTASGGREPARARSKSPGNKGAMKRKPVSSRAVSVM